MDMDEYIIDILDKYQHRYLKNLAWKEIFENAFKADIKISYNDKSFYVVGSNSVIDGGNLYFYYLLKESPMNLEDGIEIRFTEIQYTIDELINIILELKEQLKEKA
jgi:hypothetical protein